ncbi:hypothetical protein FQV27_15710 [Paracoccus aurantiacus]|uniref:Uncharacterized protein n=1 Tax=Paracoccus aurantiacus TaxID=2599412 RepID=A0A5C6RZL7_9RHOB|nr:hypothetical protein [Paracoccus aurantiacus]TXB67537.1 hypothetical protein FQV27_15710 [Paracoccus aurantiacus]
MSTDQESQVTLHQRMNAAPMPPATTMPAMVAAPAISLAVLMIAATGIAAGKWDAASVFRDPATQFGFPIYGGFVSALGFAGWIVAATAGGIGAALLPHLRRTLLAAFMLSMMLGIDDRFMLHEALLPRIGIPEEAVLLIYAVLCLCAMWPFRAELVRFRMPLLAIALLLFVLSLVVDDLTEYSSASALMTEDMAKFAGIVFWATHWCHFTILAVRRRMAAAQRGGIE